MGSGKAFGGGDIVLNKEQNIVMEAAKYPRLAMYVGQDLILTDGTTLLGGDDKAAITSIMTMAEYFCRHPELPRQSRLDSPAMKGSVFWVLTSSTLNASVQTLPILWMVMASAILFMRTSTEKKCI